MTQKVDAAISARWVIPIHPLNEVWENTTLIIDDGRIVDICPDNTLKHYQPKREFKLNHHAVMPGFVNCHTHSPMVLLRSLADDLPLMEWLEKYIWPVEGEWVSQHFVKAGTELAIAEMIRSGTTCFNEHYFYPDVLAETAHHAGMRARIGLFVMDIPNPWGQTAKENFENNQRVLESYRDLPLVSFSIAPHAPYTTSDDTLKHVASLADEYQFPIHMHVHEASPEINESLKKYKIRPLKRLQNLRLLSELFQCVHMTQVDDEDIEILKSTESHVVHCPQSNLKLNSGLCPVQGFLDEGINVALGTDGAASNNNLDMLEEMRTSALMSKVIADDPQALAAAQALEMMTYNGAKALGWDHEIGTIEKTKAADLIAIDMHHPGSLPVYNPISQIAYSVNSQQVSHVWVAGRLLCEDNRLVTLDEDAILDQTEQWASKIVNHLG